MTAQFLAWSQNFEYELISNLNLFFSSLKPIIPWKTSNFVVDMNFDFSVNLPPVGVCDTMTEVVDMAVVPDHRVATVRHYEAGPPPGLELVSTFTIYRFVVKGTWNGPTQRWKRGAFMWKICWINGSSLCTSELWCLYNGISNRKLINIKLIAVVFRGFALWDGY